MRVTPGQPAPIPLFDPAGGERPFLRPDHASSVTAWRSGVEGVFAGDPSARREATEDGVEHPLPRSEHGGRLYDDGKTAKQLADK